MCRINTIIHWQQALHKKIGDNGKCKDLQILISASARSISFEFGVQIQCQSLEPRETANLLSWAEPDGQNGAGFCNGLQGESNSLSEMLAWSKLTKQIQLSDCQPESCISQRTDCITEDLTPATAAVSHYFLQRKHSNGEAKQSQALGAKSLQWQRCKWQHTPYTLAGF